MKLLALAILGLAAVPNQAAATALPAQAGHEAKRETSSNGTVTSLSLTGHSHEMFYTVPVMVGTPGVQINLTVDVSRAATVLKRVTGSHDWEWTSAPYDPGQSTSWSNVSTFEEMGQIGTIGTDIVELGSSSVQVPIQFIQETRPPPDTPTPPTIANRYYLGMEPSIASNTSGGSLGLGASSSLPANTGWAQPQFGLYLKRSRKGSVTYEDDDRRPRAVPDDGQITLGGLNASWFGNNSMTYIPSAGNSSWSITLERVLVDGNPVYDEPTVVSVSTASSGCNLPLALIQAMMRSIPGAEIIDNSMGSMGGWKARSGYYTVGIIPCSTSARVSFTFGGVDFDLDPAELTSGRTPSFMGQDRIDENRTQCIAPLYARWNSTPDEYTLGLPFLRNVYTAFRYEPSSVGFAKLADGVYNPTLNSGQLVHSASLASMLVTIVCVCVIVM